MVFGKAQQLASTVIDLVPRPIVTALSAARAIASLFIMAISAVIKLQPLISGDCSCPGKRREPLNLMVNATGFFAILGYARHYTFSIYYRNGVWSKVLINPTVRVVKLNIFR